MAGTVDFTENTLGTVKKITVEWESGGASPPAGDGKAEATTDGVYDGKILAVYTIPGTASDQPDDNYDVEVEDSDEFDVLMGEGEDRHESNSQLVDEGLGYVASSRLTFKVSDAGRENKGTIVLWIR